MVVVLWCVEGGEREGRGGEGGRYSCRVDRARFRPSAVVGWTFKVLLHKSQRNVD